MSVPVFLTKTEKGMPVYAILILVVVVVTTAGYGLYKYSARKRHTSALTTAKRNNKSNNYITFGRATTQLAAQQGYTRKNHSR